MSLKTLASQTEKSKKRANIIALAEKHEDSGATFQAVRCFAKLLESDSSDRVARESVARIRAKEKEISQSELQKCVGEILRTKDRQVAATLAMQLGDRHPTNTTVLNRLGTSFARAGDRELAFAFLECAAALDPTCAMSLANLGLLALKSGEQDRAIELLARSTAQKPGNVLVENAYALALFDSGDGEAAVDRLRKLAKDAPENFQTHLNLGNFLRSANEKEEARQHYHKCLALKPDDSEVVYALSMVCDGAHDEHMIENIQSMIERTSSQRNLVALHFALGKLLDDRGEVDRAFEQFESANMIGYPIYGGDPQNLYDFSERVRRRIEHGRLSDLQHQEINIIPIFIIGMPRSGTSLLERELSKATGAFPTGENNIVPQAITRLFNDEKSNPSMSSIKECARAIRAEYLKKHARYFRENNAFLEKLPGNFLWIPLIRLAFPEACFVSLHREKMAVCWSIFRRRFFGGMNGWTWRAKDISTRYDYCYHLIDQDFGRISNNTIPILWKTRSA